MPQQTYIEFHPPTIRKSAAFGFCQCRRLFFRCHDPSSTGTHTSYVVVVS